MEFSCDYSRKDAVNLGIDFWGEKKNLAYLPFASQEMHFIQIQSILKTECCTMNSRNGFVK